MANTKLTPFRLDEETLARLDAIGRHLDSKWPETRPASRADAIKFAIMSTFLRLEDKREQGKCRPLILE